ncbi:hypothetical protein DVH05_006673 [Phytophthora capsici]|nr:hypothetical protein DVH05_009664 [Phytophthora capsici]KAG1686369.1 hypothetical protein DVH05_006673 [Phytophthora capsici]
MDLAGILAEGDDNDWDASQWEDGRNDEEEKQSEPTTPTEAAEEYINRLTPDSGLHLLKRKMIERAYRTQAEAGLFGIFVNEKLKGAWRKWTNEVMDAKCEPRVTVAELDAYIGLEMAMSLIPITDIKEFWSDKRFQGHPGFKATISRNRFQLIRESLKVHPPRGTSHKISTYLNRTLSRS